MTRRNSIKFPDFDALKRKINHTQTSTNIGCVVEACGTIIRVSGLTVNVGELCRLYNLGSDWELMAEVIGLDKEYALLTPLGSIHGVSNTTKVVSTGHAQQVHVGEALLGRVLDGHGRLLSTKQWIGDQQVPLYADPPDPVKRNPIEKYLATGIRSIDTLLTCGEGQRTGIFAAAGGGKSTLLGMLARGADADINVIALIGERGREVNEFIQDVLGDSLSKSIVVVSTSDRPALERARASYVATSIAEHFRDQGKRVLLLMDSVTRFARALRDVGLAAGEPPTRRGFPPSVFSTLPQLLERSGNNDKGSITAYYTVLMEDEDSADPIAEEVRSILDGHVVLSRELAAKNHFPAIDVLSSASRLMHKLVTPTQWRQAGKARGLLSKYRDIELLVQMGEYKPGHDADADAAIAVNKKLTQHLQQSFDSLVSYDEAHLSLSKVMKGAVE